MDNELIIKINDLKYQFIKDAKKEVGFPKTVFKANDFVIVKAENGYGKSTFLKLLLGFDVESYCELKCFDVEYKLNNLNEHVKRTQKNRNHVLEKIRRSTCYVEQEDLNGALSVGDYLQYPSL